MPKFEDMLQCSDCGTWYLPQETATGRVQPHCQRVLWLSQQQAALHALAEIDAPIVLGPGTGKTPERGIIIDEEV